MIKRTIQPQIKNYLFKNKIIIIYGPRQVGKTTLSKRLLRPYGPVNGRYFNCELLTINQALSTTNEQALKNYLGSAKIVVFDEAQHIKNIGLVLKILIDTFPHIQIIATGSSSFDLANKISEPLTGRSIKFTLYPLSIQEIKNEIGALNLQSSLEKLLRFGSYPKVFLSPLEEARTELDSIASNYLYKDILKFEKLKKPSLLLDLLQLLALQVGNQVSYHELATNLKTSSATVAKYIDLLEKTFVIFKLRSFSRNLRKEISKSIKVYFYDLGIRNSLIQNFNPLKIRPDIGALWENFCLIERIKANQAKKRLVNSYFWRTYSQQEIDYLEESAGQLNAFEFKWNPNKKPKAPKDFLNTYQNSQFKVITPENYLSFLA